MIKAVYPGSFDPLTFGHINIIDRSRLVFSELTILVANSSTKSYLFSMDERINMLKEYFNQVDNLTIVGYDGLTVEYLEETKSQVIIRGIRSVADFEYEMTMAATNRAINSEVETFLIFPEPVYQFVSSHGAKEVASLGGDVSSFVPQEIANLLTKKLGTLVE